MDLVEEAGENGQRAVNRDNSLPCQGFEIEWAGRKKMSLAKATQIVGYSPLLYKGME
jgi:hypothetical protein